MKQFILSSIFQVMFYFGLQDLEKFLQLHHKRPVRLKQIVTEVVLACVYALT